MTMALFLNKLFYNIEKHILYSYIQSTCTECEAVAHTLLTNAIPVQSSVSYVGRLRRHLLDHVGFLRVVRFPPTQRTPSQCRIWWHQDARFFISNYFF